jgi:hypothetical protein
MINEACNASNGQNVYMNDPTMTPEIVRHGAYICLQLRNSQKAEKLPIEEMASEAEFRNEYFAGNGHSCSYALIRRTKVTPANTPDPALMACEAMVHVSSPNTEEVEQFCRALAHVCEGVALTTTRRGVQRPPVYSSAAMKEFAYAHQVQQRPGHEMPNVFFLPMSKTAEWWSKDWMERHSYFLPKYEGGEKKNDGHALAAASGIAHLYRRTYKHITLPAPEGEYDFLNYFECADSGVPVFHEVCTALRDQGRNPEWKNVREGPLWQGRRVATWRELFQ